MKPSHLIEQALHSSRPVFLSRRVVMGAITYLCVAEAIAHGAAECGDGNSGLVVEGTRVYLNGKPYRGIGVNFYDILDHSNLRMEFRRLRELWIPFIRLDFGAFGPADKSARAWSYYFSDRPRWYALRDECVAIAEEAGIGLIPSLFWSFGTIPELMSSIHNVDENVASWLRPDSYTYQFIHEFTADVISRYSKSRAIWGFELGDEYNNGPGKTCNASALSGYEPAFPLTFTEISEIYRAWGMSATRRNTHNRLLSTGANLALDDIYACIVGAVPRPDTFRDWMNLPTATGTVSAPSLLNPKKAYNSNSVHIYQESGMPNRWFRDRPQIGPAGLIRLHKNIADEDGRVLFIGEFGSLSGTSGQDGRNGTAASYDVERKYFKEMLDSIVDSGTQLACAWNYGYLPNNAVKRWNMDPGGLRGYMLEEIATANKRMLDI